MLDLPLEGVAKTSLEDEVQPLHTRRSLHLKSQSESDSALQIWNSVQQRGHKLAIFKKLLNDEGAILLIQLFT